MTRRMRVIRWSFYAAAMLFALLLQSQLLGRLLIWGVYPMVLPCVAAIIATQEWPANAVVNSLILGAVCDTLFPAPLPCFYVIVCLLAGVLSSLVSRHLIMPGFRCSTVCCIGALLLSGLFGAVVMAFSGASFAATLSIALRESIVSLPFALVLLHPVLRYINRITEP